MPKLIVSLEEKVVEEIPIDKDIVTIGRRTDNDICLDNLSISGYHSQIKTVLNDCFLEDLNSTNGTFVNSKIVKKHALKDGDIIDIGNHRIKYINHMATSSANSDFESTVIMEPESEKGEEKEPISKGSIENHNIDNSIEELMDQIDSMVDKENKLSSVSLAKPNLKKETVEKTKPENKAKIDEKKSDYVKELEKVLSTSKKTKPDQSNEVKESKLENKKAESDEIKKEKLVENKQDGPLEVKKEEPVETKQDKSVEVKKEEPVETKQDESIEAKVEKPTENAEDTAIRKPKSSEKVGRVQILSGSNSGKELILDKSLTTLGKTGLAVVGITKRSSGYFIILIESKDDNDAKLNGEVVEGKAQPLEVHDIIEVAGIKLEFFIE